MCNAFKVKPTGPGISTGMYYLIPKLLWLVKTKTQKLTGNWGHLPNARDTLVISD